MKSLFFALALFSAPMAAHAETEPTPSLTSIEKGKWRVGGAVDISYSDRASLIVNLTPNAELFLSDDFSLGGSASATFAGDCCSAWAIGPSATYYFWKGERAAAFLGGSLSYGRHGYDGEAFAYGRLTTSAKIGFEQFLTKSVSFSPSLQWKHAFERPIPGSTSNSENILSLLGQFSVYF